MDDQKQQDQPKGVMTVVQDADIFSPDFMAIAVQRNKAFEQIREMALKATNALDWIDQEGSPFLQGSGAEKVARRFGLKIWNVRREKFSERDDQGEYYYFRYTSTVGWGTESVDAVGTCSSRDQFFGKRNGQWLPLAEVDITNIEKSAYTNCISNGVQRFLGIRNVTWEEVEKLTGVKREQVQKVEYAKGQKSSQWTPEHHDMAKRIGNYLLAEADGNKDLAASALEKLTAFKGKDGDVPGKRKLENLSGKQIEILFGKLGAKIVEYEKPGKKMEQPEAVPAEETHAGS
jgi:hypothetical protein